MVIKFAVNLIESFEEEDRRVGARAKTLPSLLLKSYKMFDTPWINSLLLMIAMMCLINDFNCRNKTHFLLKMLLYK